MPRERPSPAKSARLVPDESLPPYSYVTGRYPHPTRDPSGHSFGQMAETPQPIDADRWRQSRTYLWGCDLFNHGYYWEAHETWEELWKACGRRGPMADFLKGLIKLAAAGVKAREGRLAGVRRHATRAGELFACVRGTARGTKFLGLDLDELIVLSQQTSRLTELPATTHGAVEVVFAWTLWPD